ncbi:energy-coupling factor ABC transporter ATP-binding protein [Paenibacillus sp. P96]|uniref:ABC transporter ATP-binding protein n=1 Tax=Paenibacillus zeirhizosphaerae TaxID=2987519 RepID=A0ABT9FN55_9BACL|nr:ABC transporter ATP-binding protein [Paenibacillus sp. P96]MDP4096160.1 energy-coupling factor ABC transporter ATP-binding protein [Paenibacillus sp. P96]
MELVLEWQDVSYTYPDAKAAALAGMSLRIPKGMKTAVLGHNGSGKSTLFLHAVGILKPQGGRVFCGGKALDYGRKGLQELRRAVGLVLQDPEQQLILNTPREDVAFGLRNAGMDEGTIRHRTESALARLGLLELADRPIHHLSLGQKKRTALAGVFAMEPEVILLDEPASYLDPVSERLLLQSIGEIHRAGVTVVMATHDMDTAYSWADWIVVLDRGACRMQGPPDTIFAHKELIEELGLEMPLLADLWDSLPVGLREGRPVPRNTEQFKAYLANDLV